MRGLHCHIGSQITDAAPYVRAVEVALDLIEAAERAIGGRLEFLNAGGGFAVPYRRVVPAALRAADYFCSHRAAGRLRGRRLRHAARAAAGP